MVSEMLVCGQMASLLLGPWQGTHHGVRTWQRRAAHLMAGRMQRERKGLGMRYTIQGHAPSNLLFPTWPHLLVLTPSNNAIKLWIHQWINTLIRLEASWSNHLPKTPPLNIALGTKPSTHEFFGDISYPNHNILLVASKGSCSPHNARFI
jgi:hypothetical protein